MNDLFDRVWERKFAFLGAFFLVFTITYVLLMAIDFLPEAPAATADTHIEILDAPAEVSSVEVPEVAVVTELAKEQELAIIDSVEAFPISITIPKLDKAVTVLNPQSRTIADLDAALLDGVVRHPDSATLNQEGNVFILGHSSYLPQVFNKNFQAFNGIQNLEWGDTIEVKTEDSVYSYRVEKVYRAKAQDVSVPIAGAGYRLTLATCNSFGSTDDRYIVEAKRVEVEHL
ncbi:sortase [Candidatus Kaiserbacteria bacterium]|nr:sortase [Candidatus Kaiserbacteria bacterium]